MTAATPPDRRRPRATLAEIVRGFGIEPDAIRFAGKRSNAHWRIRAGGDAFALRRFGVWGRTTPGDVAWEIAAVEACADAGAPVARPIALPRVVDGEVYLMMPWLGGRVLRHPPVSDAEYRRLGALLAEHHLATAGIATPAQRPGWEEWAKGAAPQVGGDAQRDQLLEALATIDRAASVRFRDAAEALAARALPAQLADQPRRIVHGDFCPWNVKVAGGRLTGLIDFEGAHVDVRAADVAAARRGYHDAVVAGYLSVAPLTDAELGALDGLWLGGVLAGVWRMLEAGVAARSDLAGGLGWALDQLEKTRPYRG